MPSSYEWIIKLIDQVSGPAARIVGATGATTQALDKTAGSAQGLFYRLGSLAAATTIVTGLNAAIGGLAQPAVAFETAAAEVKAITGATAQQMELMERAARGISVEMGGAAAGHLTTYKSLLSELGPQLATQPAALTSMGRAVAILSKSMGGDTVGAVSALTTGLQQFRVDLTNPTGAAQAMTFQMNVMAAAANAGAAEVPQIAAALKQAGVAASGAHVSFVETNAAIQVLAQGGIKGAEAGTALRNVLAKLGEGRFMPKDVREGLTAAGVDIGKLSNQTLPLADRLRELGKIQGDGALVSKLFGLENQNAASILLRGVPQLGEYQKAITGTNAAVDAAGTLMNTHASRMERMKAQWEAGAMAAWKYVEPYGPMIQGAAQIGLLLTQLTPVLGGVAEATKFVAKGLWNNLTVPLWENRQQILGWARTLILGSAQGIGSFLLSLGRGVLGIGEFATRIRLQAVLAIGGLQARLRAFSMAEFLTSMAAGAWGALQAGAAWLWAGLTGLPALVAGFVRATVAQWALNVAMSANPIGAIVLGMVALGTAIYLIIKHWDVVKSWLLDLGKFILKWNPFSLLLEGAKSLFPGFEAWLDKLWGKIKSFLHSMLGTIKGIWDKVAPYLGLGSFKLPDLSQGLFAGMPDFGDGKDLRTRPGDMGAGAGLSGISGGGSKPTTIIINVAKFQDSINITTNNLKEGVNDAVAMLEEGLLRVLNGVQAAPDGSAF